MHIMHLCQSSHQACSLKAQRRPLARSVAVSGRRIRSHRVAAEKDAVGLSAKELSSLFSVAPLDPEQQEGVERLAQVLSIPVGTAKSMAYKKRGLVGKEPDEIRAAVELLADIVDVPLEQAKQMVVIQPGLLFDTQREATTLAAGIKSICYELKADKEEVVRLIIENQSVLHGRQMHLSVADIAHLAMMREPTGRIVD